MKSDLQYATTSETNPGDRSTRSDTLLVGGLEVEISGRFPKIIRLKNEFYDHVTDPTAFLHELKEAGHSAHLFTFLEEPHQQEARFSYFHEHDAISIMPITDYQDWLMKRIDAKTRNMIRKAEKKGIVLRKIECDERLIRGVVDLYNESPVRQGRRFWHYGLDYEGVKAHLETFLDRSLFVGAFLHEELVGFYKLTRNSNSASLMQIISKLSVRDAAPNNALLAHAVEMCGELKIPYLQYGIWGQGGLADYKKKHGFVRFKIPRYYVPLNSAGRLALGLRLYRRPAEFIPKPVRDKLVALRAAWYERRRSVE